MPGADKIGAGGRRNPDLAVRAATALVMVAVAGGAFWAGGLAWTVFVALVGLGVFWEWFGLSRTIAHGPAQRGLWNAGGLIYIGLGMAVLIAGRATIAGAGELLALMAAVIATDICAYFSGRTFGGPKIAPRISPSKTWAGLIGGMVGSSLVMIAAAVWQARMAPGSTAPWLAALAVGAGVAVVAQAGDFFESWMKRRAGVKDSGRLLPGHGGLFDRVDGLLAVLFVTGALFAIGKML